MAQSLNARLYDARGNRYVVATPAMVRAAGIALPESAAAAARAHAAWSLRAVDDFCRVSPGPGDRPHRSDGLLIGPFGDGPPYALLVVNTDGSLAERSGNGLTIFATSLRDGGAKFDGEFELVVHHGAGATRVAAAFAQRGGRGGVWLDLGVARFGAHEVGAREGTYEALADGRCRVGALAAIDGAWTSTQFVRIGNPHAVTLLPDADLLPDLTRVSAETRSALRQIADAQSARGGGAVCPAGINLQWAAKTGAARIDARVFERGEGPTASSGSSASAVAAAALKAGWVAGPEIEVAMPGGVAPLLAQPEDGSWRLKLFGEARRVS